MGFLKSKELSTPSSGTPAYLYLRTAVQEIVNIYKNVKILLKTTYNYSSHVGGIFQVDKII